MRQLVVTVPVEFEEQVIEALQETCRLKNITKTNEGEATRICCYVAAQEAGIVLHELDKVGCGAAYGKVAMLPIQLLKPLPNVRDRHRHLMTLVNKKTWRLRGRMATEEIYTSVASGSQLSFDYLAFVVVAGLIAAVGLAVNSPVMIVASMLVSPLMGPILAFAFGTSVKDAGLVWRGVFVEAVGVTLTFLVGFIVGLGVCLWTGVANGFGWPTAEMESRGEVSGLVTGVFFAIPSGAGVALSTTQGGTTALVGVAIAASLLPPIVNCGMCLAFAAAGARRIGMKDSTFYRISWMSLALFLINVFCIYTVCLLFFWIKGIKAVRKQLSRYRDLPPIQLKPKEQAGSGTLPKHATTSPGALTGYDTQQQAATATIVTVGGVATAAATATAGGGAGNVDGVAAAAPSAAAGGSARAAEVVIQVGSGSALRNGGDGAAHQPGSTVSSRHGSGSHGGMGRRGTGGLLGPLLRLGGTSVRTDSDAIASKSRAKSPQAGAGQQVRGWGRVRKLVLEDKALKQQNMEDLPSPKVHNI